MSISSPFQTSRLHRRSSMFEHTHQGKASADSAKGSTLLNER
jgi:hypothetical protein